MKKCKVMSSEASKEKRGVVNLHKHSGGILVNRRLIVGIDEMVDNDKEGAACQTVGAVGVPLVELLIWGLEWIELDGIHNNTP